MGSPGIVASIRIIVDIFYLETSGKLNFDFGKVFVLSIVSDSSMV